MADDNRPLKYMRYAIGEIVLVVIGILIALQINNWNESQKERRVESNILKEILVNLDDDLKNLGLKIKESDKFYNNSSKVLEHLQTKAPITESLKHNYWSLIGHGNFEPNTIGYEYLNAKGIDIIQNESLRQSISELYGIKYFGITQDRRMITQTFMDKQLMLVLNNLKFYKNYEKAEPINLVELSNNIPFQSMLITNRRLLKNIINNYEKVEEEIKIVQRQIQEELEK